MEVFHNPILHNCKCQRKIILGKRSMHSEEENDVFFWILLYEIVYMVLAEISQQFGLDYWGTSIGLISVCF